jgi:molybdate-binding protein
VSLKLARELEVRVDELFSLASDKEKSPTALQSDVLSAGPLAPGQAVQLCAVGDHLVSVPVSPLPTFLPDADGVIARVGKREIRADVSVASTGKPFTKRIVIAGCDPAIGLLQGLVEQLTGVQIVPAAATSRLALGWLKAGKVHVAGTHLKDDSTGEFNVPIIRRELPDEDLMIVTFAHWEEGFVISPGNPKRIRKPTDLAEHNVRIVNREPGSGSRALLDGVLMRAGVGAAAVSGYETIAHGHLAAAYAVHTGEAECCIATRSAARTFGLDFVPLQSERYDFVLRRSVLELPSVQNFLDVLQRAALRRKLELVAGYDSSHTGESVT